MLDNAEIEENDSIINYDHTIFTGSRFRMRRRNIHITSLVFPLTSNTHLNFDEYKQQKQVKQQTLQKIQVKVIRKRIGKCSICCQTIKSCNRIGILQCKHKYHFKCLRKWLKYSLTCPLCRHNV